MKLYLDDERKTPDGWERVYNYNEFVEFITNKGLPDIISFDHDLADEHYKECLNNGFNFNYENMKEKTGYDCLKWLFQYCINNEKKIPECLIHTMNPVGKENMKKYIERYRNLEV